MKRNWIATLIVGVTLMGGPAAWAGQLEDGTAAHERGDFATAVKLWRLSADQGNLQAQFFLGTMYENGKGVAQDYKEAMKWYRRAATRQDYGAPQYALGSMYVKARGVPQDNVRGYMWYHLAASAGDPVAAMLRDALAKKMTPAEIRQAEDMAKRCQQSNHKDCG